MRARPLRSVLFAVLAVLLAASSLGARGVRGEEFTFQTDVHKVMKIIINSLYHAKDIFLRELISNASDAIDKVRFLGITDKAMLADNAHLNITIRADPKARTLTITDSGIGMTKDDLKNNLGTIAKSGTADFLQAAEKSKQQDQLGLIGQFGVGFYSAYLVADQVRVISKHPKDDSQWVWSSDADSKFSIAEDKEGPQLGRGTQIVLHLKEDAADFLQEGTLRSLIQRYSQFIQFPIYLHTTKQVTEEVEAEADNPEDPKSKTDADKKVEGEDDKAKKVDSADKDKKPEDDEMIIESEDSDEAKEKAQKDKKKKQTITKEVQDWEQINTQKPLWLRLPKEVEAPEYNEFYKSYFTDMADPAAHIHFLGEGGSDFKALLFIPERPPVSVMQMSSDKGALHNIKLFVRRVFITDQLVDFLPKYLSFLRGLIDSDDFPLNVSRETLQQSPLLDKIKNKIISKAIQMMRKLSNNETLYEPFYKAYSGHIKMGIMEDKRNQKKLAPLLRFATTANGNLTSLDEYLERMRKGQKAIYFLTGDNREQMRKSPYLETLTRRGYEVLLMDDHLDDYMLQSLPSYGSVRFQNIGKGKLEFGDEDEDTKKKEKELADQFQPLTTWLTGIFKDIIDSTVISNRLTSSPCALVASEYGWTGRMQSMMAMQKDSNMMYDYFANQKKTLEINPAHPVIQALLAKVEDDQTSSDVEDMAHALLDMAWLKGGYPVPDMDAVTKRIENVVRVGLAVDLSATAKVDVKDAPKVEPQAPAKDHDDDENAAGHDEL